MQEIELKYQVPAAARAEVAADVAGPDKPNRVRLQAAYYDTAERDLAAAGLALRVRREGRRWVQTLKGAASDGLTRAEHNVPRVAAARELPLPDPLLHAGTPAGERLLALLGVSPTLKTTSKPARSGSKRAPKQAPKQAPVKALLCLYRTDIWRRTRAVTVPGPGTGTATATATASADPAAGASQVELAFDEGFIIAGERRLAVCELEVELLSGSALAVIDTAEVWSRRHGLWLDTRTKAERGGLLVRGEPMAPPCRARKVRLNAQMHFEEALGAVLSSCLEQVSVNASQLASGEFLPEHLHQLRVGLRRLRSAWRLFAPPRAGERLPGDVPSDAAAPATAEALAEAAGHLFRQLGAARDADAVAQPLAEVLGNALQSVGLSGELTLPAHSVLVGVDGDSVDPLRCVRAVTTQRLFLGLLRQVQQLQTAPAPAAATTWQEALGACLQRWHRQVLADAKRFPALDDEARHQLRKRAKRLRYAVEFSASLYPKKAVAAYLKPLRAVQERLGALNDLAVGVAAFRSAGPDDPRALFALGWLASQREALLRKSAADLDRFIAAKRFWRH